MTHVTGKKAKVRTNFFEKFVQTRCYFGISGFWVGFWASTYGHKGMRMTPRCTSRLESLDASPCSSPNLRSISIDELDLQSAEVCNLAHLHELQIRIFKGV